MHPPIKNENIKDDYDKFGLENYQRLVELLRVPQFKKDIKLIKNYKVKGKLLDIGSGTGEFLEIADEEGFISYGIEPSIFAWRIAKKRENIINEEWESSDIKENFFDVITFWSVLEHMPDPISSLEKARSSLVDNGIIAIRTPVSSGLLIKISIYLYKFSGMLIKFPLKIILQLCWRYPHFYIFNLSNLRYLLEKSGFQILDYRFEDSYDLESSEIRLQYLNWKPFVKNLVKIALLLIKFFASIIKRKDEIVIIAKKHEKKL